MEIERKLVMLPGPTNVSERVMKAMITPITNHRSEDFWQLHRRLVEKGRAVFETSSDIVVLTASGTGGVEAAVANIVRSGDKIVIPVFGEFSHRLADTVTAYGGDVIRVDAPFGDAPTVDRIEEAFKGHADVKGLFIVYNETSTGVRYPWLKEAGEVAARYGAFFVVDAVSNLGGDHLPVDAFGVDICVTGSQKCLAAPPGVSILSVSERVKKYVNDNPPSTPYFSLPRYFRFAERGETPYTPVLPLFYALDEAFSIILEEGLPQRIRRHKVCAEAFYTALQTLGLRMFAKEDVRSNTVIAVNYPDGVEDKTFRRMLEHEFRVLVAGGFGEYRGRLFRIGSMGEVNQYHVMTTLSAISSTLNLLGYRNDPGQVLEAAQKELKELT